MPRNHANIPTKFEVEDREPELANFLTAIGFSGLILFFWSRGTFYIDFGSFWDALTSLMPFVVVLVFSVGGFRNMRRRKNLARLRAEMVAASGRPK